jgi:hypothetical protein
VRGEAASQQSKLSSPGLIGRDIKLNRIGPAINLKTAKARRCSGASPPIY